MNYDNLVFPIKKSSYSFSTYDSDMIYVPRYYNKSQPKELQFTNIPCLFLPNTFVGSSKLLIYFHANGEDIGNCYDFCINLNQ